MLKSDQEPSRSRDLVALKMWHGCWSWLSVLDIRDLSRYPGFETMDDLTQYPRPHIALGSAECGMWNVESGCNDGSVRTRLNENIGEWRSAYENISGHSGSWRPLSC